MRCRRDPPRALPAPGPLEDYAAQFDDLFANVAQRRAIREYLHGLLLPRERTKTLAGGIAAQYGQDGQIWRTSSGLGHLESVVPAAGFEPATVRLEGGGTVHGGLQA